MAGRPIDEKIVAMKMDNSDFVRKASETTSIFGKIQSALSKVPSVNMSKITDSFSSIQSAASRIDLTGMANSVEAVANRFSNLGVVATTALATIANKATLVGGQLLKSVTIQPLMDGFREYENKMSSIGVILNNTEWNGSNLGDVKKTLGELNDYADNTIYSFEQMTANVGRFTAAGVSLDDSAVAIKGLGNLAAVSGSDVDQLNTVMYQMSQALASGKLNLMDWNSLVNGGMAGKKTQDALVATAKKMGKNVDLTDGFRNSIEQGWLTSEVFLETLKKFGKDKSMTEAATSVRTFTGMLGALKESIGSGWATTWELIFGDFEVATRRWTALSEVVTAFFQKGTDARNNFVKGLADAGVFEGLFNIFVNTGKAVLDIFGAIGKGISAAFSGTNIGFVEALGKGLNKFASYIKPSEKTLQAITTIFQALFSVVNIVVRALVGLGKIILAVIAVPFKIILLLLDGLISGILSFASYVGTLVIAFTNGVISGKNLSESLGGLKGVFSAMGSVIGKVGKHISTFGSAIQEAWSIIANGKFSGVGPWSEDSAIVAKLFKIREAVFNFCSGVVEAWNIIVKGNNTGKGPWDKDSEIVGKLFRIRKAAFDFASGVQEAWNILAKGDFTGVGPWEEDSAIVDRLFRIREAVIEFGSAVKEAYSILFKGNFTGKGPWSEDSSMVRGLVKIREGFQNIGKFVSNLDFSSVLTVILGAFKLIGDAVSNLDFGNILLAIAKGFEFITGAVSGMSISLAPVGRFFGTLFKDIGSGIDWLKDKFSDIGEAIKNAMPSGSQLFAGGFIAGLIAVVGVVIKMGMDLYDVFTGWGKIGKGVSDTLDSVSGALNAFTASIYANALLTIAIAIGILALSFWGLSKLNGNQIAQGLYMIIGSLSALVGAMAIMSKYDITGTGMKAAIQIVALSVAFLILSSALSKVSNLSWGEITKGLYGLIGVMGTFAGAVVLMSRFGGANLAVGALQMLAIAGTVWLLVVVLKQIAGIDTMLLVKGMTGLAVALGIFAGAVTIMSRFGNGKIAASALQFIAIAASILIMVEAINRIAEIKVGDLLIGLATITLILAAIAAFSIVTSGTGLLSAGIGVTLLAIALNLLIIPISALGTMDLGTLVQGLGALAIALIAIGAASMLMTGMVAAGAGLILLAIGMNLLLIPIMAFSAMSLGALATGIIALAGGILLIGGAAALLGLAGPALILGAAGIALLGIAMLAAGAGISLFATGLVALAAMTGAAVTTIVAFLTTLIMGLASLIPLAINFVVQLVVQIATAITTNAPLIVGKIAEMLLAMLNVFATYIPQFVTAATNIIVNFLNALTANYPRIIESATTMMVTFVEALAASVQANGPRFLTAIMTLMAEVMVIIVQAGAAVVAALFGWIPGVTSAAQSIGDNAETTIRDAFDAQGVGTQKGTDFSSALGGTTGAAQNAGTQVGNGGKSGASSVDLSTIGTAKGAEFVAGLGSKTGASQNAGTQVANGGKSGAGSVSLTGEGSGAGIDFASALGAKSGAAQSSGVSLANGGKSGASSVSLNSAGSNFGAGFASGISGAWDSVFSAAKSLASAAKSAVEGALDMHSPSRVMIKDGGFFGEGFGIGIKKSTKGVADKAKGLAITAKDSLNEFLDGFELPEEDNELRFKAVIDYDALDVSRFGNVASLGFVPNLSATSGITSAVYRPKLDSGSSQNGDNTAIIGQQEEQINLLKQQNGILSNISNKDTSLYLDSKEIYNSNKKIQNSQATIRNIFKGENRL